jgi:predicted regulator of Ras-like GTPase activity (Roadblock/LC7/MglB family)
MFDETLKTIVTKTEGAVGAVIMGLDGISVAQAIARPGVPFEVDAVAAEYTALLRKLMKTSEDASLGALQELIVASDRVAFLITTIASEYFLMLVLEPRNGIGRARFELRKAQLLLEEEFSI